MAVSLGGIDCRDGDGCAGNGEHTGHHGHIVVALYSFTIADGNLIFTDFLADFTLGVVGDHGFRVILQASDGYQRSRFRITVGLTRASGDGNGRPFDGQLRRIENNLVSLL